MYPKITTPIAANNPLLELIKIKLIVKNTAKNKTKKKTKYPPGNKKSLIHAGSTKTTIPKSKNHQVKVTTKLAR